MAAGIVIFGTFPKLADFIGHKLGVGYPPILLVIITLVAMGIKMLKMDIERSEMETKIRRLTQRLALLEGEQNDDSENRQ